MKHDYSHILLDHFIKRMRKITKERDEILKQIKTVKDAKLYQQQVKKIIKQAFSPLPEKTPLNPRITGIEKRKKYRIEKIIFESRPECFVTANLYIPEHFSAPFPAVIGTCGHSATGKAEPRYQEFCQRLVQNGFLVFIYDPFNQGERDQYITLPKNSILRRSCCAAHNMMGKQLQLIGEFFGSWRLWDGIRALDYVLTRHETEKNFIGITGNSGGGTMTTWLWGNEPRFTAAAPSCFITPFRYNIENEMPQDIEQCPPGILGHNIDIADFFISRAPEPLILLGQKYDYFDIRGFKEICDQVKKIYKIFDAEDNFSFFIGSNPHGYYPDAQKNMVSFFCKIAGKKDINSEPEINIEKSETLFATEKGNVVHAGSKPVYVIIGKKAEDIERTRPQLPEDKLKEKIRKLLKIPEIKETPHYRVLRPQVIKKSVIARYAVESEQEIWVILKKKADRPDFIYNLQIEDEINLCLPHISSEDEILKKRKFLPGMVEYFVDVRGLGESMPEEKKNFFRPYGYDFMMDMCYAMFGETYFGKRIFDVLSVIKLLEEKGCKTINLYGNHQGALIGLFVAFLSVPVKKVYLKNLPESFCSLCKKLSTELPSANFPKGIMKITDIPEILNYLKKTKEAVVIR